MVDECLESDDASKDGTKEPNDKQFRKLRRIIASQIWSMFELFPLTVDKKKRCKCKKWGAVYMCNSSYGTGNLRMLA